MRSGNPVLNDRAFEDEGRAYSSGAMTLDGTVHKAFLMLVIVVGSALVSWNQYFAGKDIMRLVLFSLITGVVLAVIIVFVRRAAPYLAPVYAAAQGTVVGCVSAKLESMYQGITLQAVLLTMAVFVALLLAYRARLIQATEPFKLFVFSATSGIAIMYLLTFVLGLFGTKVPYVHDSSWIGIGISLFVVVIAAFNLVVDFDYIETGVQMGSPKYMEWYAAFGLIVTLIWLYFEIIRLLSKLRGR